jgi:ClpX C4-type zinc finger
MIGKKKAPAAPPPVLATCRILWHATIRKPAQYSGHSHLFVNGREVGPVPRLAICENLARREEGAALLHCGRNWSVLGVAGYKSIREARARAAHIYPGVEKQWIRGTVSKRQAIAYLNEVVWRGQRCGFCGKRPYEVGQWFTGRGASICDGCVRSLSRNLSANLDD